MSAPVLVVNQKFAGMRTPFAATHVEFGEGRVDYIRPNGKMYFIAEGDEKGKFVKADDLTGIVVDHGKCLGALTGYQARFLTTLAEQEGTTLEYFSEKNDAWKSSKNPSWKMNVNYRVILA